MPEPTKPVATVRTLLLTDVVDSTRLAEQLGDTAMAALWARHDRLARDLLPLHHGREIDKTDGFLLLFDQVGDAVGYAVAYHRALRELGVAARAGIHVGPVILTENAAADVARGAKPLEVDGLAKPTAARVMSVATGGQTLLTRDAADALGASPLRVVSHGHWRMKGVAEPLELLEIGDTDAPMAPPPDGAKVYRVVEQEGVWVPVRDVRHRLPAERDRFVGRSSDLRALAEALEGARLVSLLGLGGTGKTRLATRFAWTWLGDFQGGAWFCDLSEARSPEDICRAVATTLDVPLLGQRDPVAVLGHAIAGRGECLIVLDNFEQVARHAPETLGKWLDRAKDARFLVTTRDVLGLPGEATLPLAPLSGPDSLALFVTRAKQAKPDFVADDEDSLRSLVALLDGLPLAIELAAARVRLMPPKVLLQRMTERFRLLASSGGRTGRQATLRATFDWSWELLDADERAALAQVSVFEGGFTVESAEGVLGLAERWPMDAVQALVDRSWVRQSADGRLDLLVSVQEYAAEKLAAAGDTREAEARHGAWFAQHGTQAALDALHSHGGVARLQALRLELDNLVAACRRAVNRGDVDVAVATMRAAAEALGLVGPTATQLELAERVLGLDLPAVGRIAALRLQGDALRLAGRPAEARVSLDAGLALAREIGDRVWEARVLVLVGALAYEAGRDADAQAAASRAVEIGEAIGDARIQAGAHSNLGMVSDRLGRPETALAGYQRTLALHRATGNRRDEGRCLGNIGSLLLGTGRLLEARARLEESLVVSAEVGDIRSQGAVLSNLGLALLDLGELGQAVVAFERAVAIHRAVGHRVMEAICLGNIGYMHFHLGAPDVARPYFEQAWTIHGEFGFTYGQAIWAWGLARLEADKSSDGWRPLMEEAVRLSEPYAVVHAEALAIRARLRVRFGETESARSDVEAARALGPKGRVAVVVALADAYVAHAEGRAEAVRAALAEADRVTAETHLAASSPTGRELATARALEAR